MAKTKDVLQILKRVTGGDRDVLADIAEARINGQVAQMIYDARTRAGLSQRKLAELAGTKQPVIARLENADYEGHSLTMVQRIARALNRRLELRFVAPGKFSGHHERHRPQVSLGRRSGVARQRDPERRERLG